MLLIFKWIVYAFDSLHLILNMESAHGLFSCSKFFYECEDITRAGTLKQRAHGTLQNPFKNAWVEVQSFTVVLFPEPKCCERNYTAHVRDSLSHISPASDLGPKA